jgi:hypothetical protein
MKNETAEQDLASCVVGALLLAQPRLERLLLGFDLGEPHLDRLSRHVSGPFSLFPSAAGDFLAQP